MLAVLKSIVWTLLRRVFVGSSAEAGTSELRVERVVIGWKDSREARRAVMDALPFLHETARVTIVEVCGPGEEESTLENLGDIARYLEHHKIKGNLEVVHHRDKSDGEQLIELSLKEHADLLVTGAYGHSQPLSAREKSFSPRNRRWSRTMKFTTSFQTTTDTRGMRHRAWLASVLLVLALPTWAQDAPPYVPGERSYSPYPEQDFPNQVLFGDTHLHTSYSTDAGMVGNTLGPAEAYRSPRARP